MFKLCECFYELVVFDLSGLFMVSVRWLMISLYICFIILVLIFLCICYIVYMVIIKLCL